MWTEKEKRFIKMCTCGHDLRIVFTLKLYFPMCMMGNMHESAAVMMMMMCCRQKVEALLKNSDQTLDLEPCTGSESHSFN